MIDIGVNLLHAQFDHDRPAVLTRAFAAGLRHMIVTGTDLATSRAAADYVTSTAPDRLTSTAGIHPHHAHEAPPDWQEELRRLARMPGVVAIGETGLDFNRNFSPRADQERLFRAQLAVAGELDLPVFVHDREAGETVATCLAEVGFPAAGVVVHCFTGTASHLDRYLELGCHIGITGWVCDRRRGGPLRELVPNIPRERLMIETDAPFLKPHNAPDDFARAEHSAAGHRPRGHDRRNEPALLPWIARRLAELYGVAEEQIIESTTANARRFFRLDARGFSGT